LKRGILFLGIALSLIFFSRIVSAEPLVSAVSVEGNNTVVSEHILAAVKTKIGEVLSQQQVKDDIEAIYNLGFFSFVDAKFAPLSGGVEVTFQVKENPIVKEIHFHGNTVYSDEELTKLVFTTPGSIFNRVFFRHDLQRIKEKYDQDGYVLTRVTDVGVEGGIIDVTLVEPKIGDIIIQGNTRTKTYVIERCFKLKKGDNFNSTLIRHAINKVNSLGFFDDVNVGFEPGEDPEYTNIIVTVEEARTSNVGFSIGHGTSSGWSGGISYGDKNWAGKGHDASVGFEVGDDEQYWISYKEPYMDSEHYAWKVGVYKRNWDDREYWNDGYEALEYDENKVGGYFGFGKKFARQDKLSWYLTFDWHDTDISDIKAGDDLAEWEERHPKETSGDLLKERYVDGTVFSTLVTLTNNNLDPYLSYRDGDIEDLNIEKAWEILGGEHNFTKYWFTVRYYMPFTALSEFLDVNVGDKDNPPILAARARIGYSSGTVPLAEQYEIGGGTTLRGYDDDEFKGDEMLLANFELRLPIDKNFNFVVFYDTGNAWGGNQYDSNAGSISFSDLHDSYGMGVRVKTPLGNLRLDFAEGDDDNKTHFGFGEMF